MSPELLALPWKIQVALGAGYAGYILGYLGLRKFHTGADVFFKTILFSVFASGVFALKLPLQWVWECLLSIVASTAVGLLWNLKLRTLYYRLLKKIGLRYNDHPTAWLSVSHDQDNYFTQISVLLEDGSSVSCDDLSKFSDAPFGAAIFGCDGDLAFHATHVTDSAGTKKPQPSTIDDNLGYRMTYIPNNRIMRVQFRKKLIT
jgi:hypothetical protein